MDEKEAIFKAGQLFGELLSSIDDSLKSIAKSLAEISELYTFDDSDGEDEE